MFELPGRNQMDKVKAESCSAGLRFENLNTLSALNTLIVLTLQALPKRIINEIKRIQQYERSKV